MKRTVKDSIGRLGEKIVLGYLPNSIDVNRKGESHLPYDILWNGIKIDVKTTLSSNEIVTFSIYPCKRNQNVLLLLVCIQNNSHYFWVDRYADYVKKSRRLKNAITSERLVDTLTALLLLEPEIITKNTKPLTLNIPTKLYQELSELIIKIQEREGLRHISLSNLIERMKKVYKEVEQL